MDTPDTEAPIHGGGLTIGVIGEGQEPKDHGNGVGPKRGPEQSMGGSKQRSGTNKVVFEYPVGKDPETSPDEEERQLEKAWFAGRKLSRLRTVELNLSDDSEAIQRNAIIKGNHTPRKRTHIGVQRKGRNVTRRGGKKRAIIPQVILPESEVVVVAALSAKVGLMQGAIAGREMRNGKSRWIYFPILREDPKRNQQIILRNYKLILN